MNAIVALILFVMSAGTAVCFEFPFALSQVTRTLFETILEVTK